MKPVLCVDGSPLDRATFPNPALLPLSQSAGTSRSPGWLGRYEYEYLTPVIHFTEYASSKLFNRRVGVISCRALSLASSVVRVASCFVSTGRLVLLRRRDRVTIRYRELPAGLSTASTASCVSFVHIQPNVSPHRATTMAGSFVHSEPRSLTMGRSVNVQLIEAMVVFIFNSVSQR